MIGQHGDVDVDDNRKLLLQPYYNNVLCIMNTSSQHRNLYE